MYWRWRGLGLKEWRGEEDGLRGGGRGGEGGENGEKKKSEKKMVMKMKMKNKKYGGNEKKWKEK